MGFVAVGSVSLQLASKQTHVTVSTLRSQCDRLLKLNLDPLYGATAPAQAVHDNSTAGYAGEPIAPDDFDI
jgi:hypothetical protein